MARPREERFLATALALLCLSPALAVELLRAPGVDAVVATTPIVPTPSAGTPKSIQTPFPPTAGSTTDGTTGTTGTLPVTRTTTQTQQAAAGQTGVNGVSTAQSTGPQRDLLIWPGTRKPGGPLSYHQGKVLTGEINVHILFYGSWASSDADVAILSSLVQSISSDAADAKGPSVHKWWNTLLQYTQWNGAPVASKVSLGKVVLSSASDSKTLEDGRDGTSDDIAGLVDSTIASGLFPADPRGVYMVLTSADIRVGGGNGFCASYCSWHSYRAFGGVQVPYIFVGDPMGQCTGCSSPQAKANGRPSADGMATSVAHELAEVATNPNSVAYLGYWSADSGNGKNEAGDLCNRVFRDDSPAGNWLMSEDGDASIFNMYGINGYKYLLQSLPDRARQVCVVQGVVPAPASKSRSNLDVSDLLSGGAEVPLNASGASSGGIRAEGVSGACVSAEGCVCRGGQCTKWCDYFPEGTPCDCPSEQGCQCSATRLCM